MGLVRGDVELHIKKADWNSHGHGGDPNYNEVVVYGALEIFSEETRLQSGSFAPVLDLQALFAESAESMESVGSVDSGHETPAFDL